MKPPARLAVESAAALAACTADGPDKAMIEHVIRTRAEGGRVPSYKILPPLAQVAMRILDGDGTTDAAQFWRERATAAQLRLCKGCGYWLNDIEWTFDPCAAGEDGTHRES